MNTRKETHQWLGRLAKAAATLLLSMMTIANVHATDFIKNVMLIGGTKSEVNSLKETYQAQGWTVIDQDLNAEQVATTSICSAG